MYEVRRYVTQAGRDLVGEWLADIKDKTTRARIVVRFTRLAAGQLGDCKPLQGGVREMRLDFGPGYRIYFAMSGRTCVLLLCGGDKRTQLKDIKRALTCWQDYQRRTS